MTKMPMPTNADHRTCMNGMLIQREAMSSATSPAEITWLFTTCPLIDAYEMV